MELTRSGRNLNFRRVTSYIIPVYIPEPRFVTRIIKFPSDSFCYRIPTPPDVTGRGRRARGDGVFAEQTMSLFRLDAPSAVVKKGVTSKHKLR
jgi:hypothetical protein